MLFRGDIVRRNKMLITLRDQKVDLITFYLYLTGW